MKKLLSIVLVIFMIAAFAGCGAKGPEAVVKSTLDGVINMDEETLAKYYDSEDLNLDDAQAKEFYTTYFSKVSYEILETKEEGDTATVKTKITTVDMSTVMSAVLTKALTLAFSEEGQSMTEDEQSAAVLGYMLEGIKSASATMKDFTVDIQLKKVDGEWEIQTSDDLTNAISGGLVEWSKTLSE